MAEGIIDQQQNEANQSIKTESLEDVCSNSEDVEDPYAKLPDSVVVLRVSLVANKVEKFIDVKPSSFGKRREAFTLCAYSDKYHDYDPSKTGKWMLFVEPQSIDAVWTKIMASIISGALGMAKVFQDKNDPAHHPSKVPIMVYTVDYTDLDDVIRVLDYLETTGLKRGNEVITYKTDEQTRAGIYRWKKNGRPWIYSSLDVRGIRKKEYKNSKSIPIVKFKKSTDFY